MKVLSTLLAFNRGLVSKLALSRLDIKRLALSAETMVNWIPRLLGSMMLRPGTVYLGSMVSASSAQCKLIPFARSNSVTALIEVTGYGFPVLMRFWENDALLAYPTTSTGPFDFTETYETGRPVTAASPAVITYTTIPDAALAVDARVSVSSISAGVTGFTVATMYYVKTVNTSTNEITVSATKGGAAINNTGSSGTLTLHAWDYDSHWTDSDETGGDSFLYLTGRGVVLPGVVPGMNLVGDGENEARRRQAFTQSGGDVGKVRNDLIIVAAGEVTFRVGSSAGGKEYGEFLLRKGVHSIGYTPGATYYLELANASKSPAVVSSFSFTGSLSISVPWTLTADVDHVRTVQSGDTIFLACNGRQPLRIERHNSKSWSVTNFESIGPFRDQNVSGITMTPSALTGVISLTASKNFFQTTHVGAVFRLESAGQDVIKEASSADTWSDSIRVIGVLAARLFVYVVEGTFTATVTLQRSIGAEGSWTDAATMTAPTSVPYTDGLENQIAYYRIGIKAGDYTSGTASLSLAYDAGVNVGIMRVTEYSSPTVVYGYVINDMGSTGATSTWWESAWSDYRGWPSAVAIHDGRLWFAGKGRYDGSKSDDFEDFDVDQTGDDAPVARISVEGQSDQVAWMASANSLLIGLGSAEMVARASALDEPLSQTQFTVKRASGYGSAMIGCVPMDGSVIFVGKGGSRLYALSPDGYSYQASDLCAMVPDLFTSPIVRFAIQRLPDTRIHCVRADGTVAVLLIDRAEQANCWSVIETDGDVIDVAVLPGSAEDVVYYLVKRPTEVLVERLATEAEARGAAVSKIADSGVVYSGASTATITGLEHLIGKTVCAWGNTKDLGTYTVSGGGTITLTENVTWAFVGLPYTAQWKSARLAIASATGNPLTQRKRLDHLGVILADAHAQGLKYGQDFDHLDNMPLRESGVDVTTGTIHAIYDEDSFEVNGIVDTDPRLCLQAQAPRPVTVLAAVVSVAGHDKV